MDSKKALLALAVALLWNTGAAQTIVKMDLPPQADQPLSVVALFDEELPGGIPVVLGLMGYNVEGGITPYNFEWLLNGEVISTGDIAIFTPREGDDLVLEVSDKNRCVASTAFDLKFAAIPPNRDEGMEQIQVYPTVFDRELFIRFPEKEHDRALVRFFDLNGILVHQEFLPGSSGCVPGLAPGAYFISVKTAEFHKVERIIAR